MLDLAGPRRRDYRRKMMMRLSPLLLVAAVSGCSLFGSGPPAPQAPAPELAPEPAAAPAVAAPVSAQGVTPEALDQTTAAERAAATAAPAATGAALGKVSVALGSPTEQGFWLKSALVTAPGKGRVELASGQSVAVDLIPAEGAALLSLAAYRALGLGLTDLPEVKVYAD